MAVLFTEDDGLVTCMAKGARKSSKRFPSLEPIHTLRAVYDPRPTQDIGILYEADISRARIGATASLRRMATATKGLGWLSKVLRPHQPEPGAWEATIAFLDDVARKGDPADTTFLDRRLASYGLHLLTANGWDLQLGACVRCGIGCPDESAAYVSPVDGGLVCRACGGGPIVLGGPVRARIIETLGGGLALVTGDERTTMRLAKQTLRAFVGIGQG